MATDRLPVGTVPGVQFNGEQRPLLLRDQESTFLPLLIAPTYDKIVTDIGTISPMRRCNGQRTV